MSARSMRQLQLSPFMRRGIAVLALALGCLSVASRISFSLTARGVTNDFTQDYISARAWSDGLDPYGETGTLVDHYFGPGSPYHDIVQYGQGGTPHPPLLIVLARPIAFLPYKVARITWLLAMAAATAVALGWFARLLGAASQTSFVIGIGALAIPVVQTDLIYGQSTGLLLLLLVATWAALRAKRDSWAGVALGIATALKLFPAFMIIPLLRARRFRAAAWQTGTAALVTGLTSLLLGFGHAEDFVLKVSSQNVRFWRAAPMNFSLLSVPYRWLTKSIWRPDATNAPGLASAIALALIVLLVAGTWRGRAAISGDAFWETVPFMLLAVPTVWESYLVLVVPLTFLVIRRLAHSEPLPFKWWLLVAIALVCIGLLPGLPPALHTSGPPQVFGYSLPMYGLLVIAIASAFGRRTGASQKGDLPVEVPSTH